MRSMAGGPGREEATRNMAGGPGQGEATRSMAGGPGCVALHPFLRMVLALPPSLQHCSRWLCSAVCPQGLNAIVELLLLLSYLCYRHWGGKSS